MSLIVEPDSLPDLADREIAAGEEPLHMGHFYLQQIVLEPLSRDSTDPPADPEHHRGGRRIPLLLRVQSCEGRLCGTGRGNPGN